MSINDNFKETKQYFIYNHEIFKLTLKKHIYQQLNYLLQSIYDVFVN